MSQIQTCLPCWQTGATLQPCNFNAIKVIYSLLDLGSCFHQLKDAMSINSSAPTSPESERKKKTTDKETKNEKDGSASSWK